MTSESAAASNSTQWVTVSQASRILGLSAPWVRRLADAGRLTMEMTPLGRLISVESVEAMRAEREHA